ncbi:MAG: hypothetical protein AB7P21_07130 [Lautropia sp.]
MPLNIHPQSVKMAVWAAIEAASAGSKRAAGHTAISSAIGASPKLELYSAAGAKIGESAAYGAALTVLPSGKLRIDATSVTITDGETPATFRIAKADGSAYLHGVVGTDAILTVDSPSSPPPPPPPAAALNSVDIVVSDMTGNNDGDFQGIANGSNRFRWQDNPNPAQIAMGAWKGSAGPDWWRGGAPSEIVDGDYWNGITAWNILANATGHTATNAAVETRNWTLRYKSIADGLWKLLRTTPGGIYYKFSKSPFGSISTAERRFPASGSIVVKYPTGENNVIHGEWDYASGNPKVDWSAHVADAGAILVTHESRLVLWDEGGTDDLDAARIDIQTGCDLVPAITYNFSVNPGVGLSRGKRVTRDWQAFNFLTMNSSGVRIDTVDTSRCITEAAFRENPPSFT